MGFKKLTGPKQLSPFSAERLTGDITAGIIVAFLLLPQSMAYAQIAGVPVELGLYAAAFPLIIYALIGTSRYLSVGPVSVISLLTFSGISSMAGTNGAYFVELVIFLALLVGIMQVLCGILRLGSFFHFVPVVLIRGFISAVAVIIICNQLGALLGVSLPGYENLFRHMAGILQHVTEINLFTAGIGIGSILLLIICKKITRPSPGSFIVILFSIVLVDFFSLDDFGVEIVGSIPMGEFSPSFLFPSWDTVFMLLPLAFMISLIAFVESFAVAGSLAEKDGEKKKLNANRELIGLGATNMTSSFIGAIPVAGAISRSAVAYQSGGRTKLTLFITAVFMLISIYFLTPLFYYLPNAALAAIIMFAVTNLIGVEEFLYDCRYKQMDAAISLITFLSVLLVDVFLGFVIGVFFSFIVRGFVKRK